MIFPDNGRTYEEQRSTHLTVKTLSRWKESICKELTSLEEMSSIQLSHSVKDWSPTHHIHSVYFGFGSRHSLGREIVLNMLVIQTNVLCLHTSYSFGQLIEETHGQNGKTKQEKYSPHVK